MSHLLKPTTVAERLGISMSNLRLMIRAGSAPDHLRLGRLIRFTEEDVDRWIAEQQIERPTAVER